MRKRVVLAALALAASASAAALLPRECNGGAKEQRRIGSITQGGAEGRVGAFEMGGRSAATALGYHLAVVRAAVEEVLRALARARVAGLPTVSYELQSPGSLWVSQTGPTRFARALADALASRMKQRGQFVILACLLSAGAYPIVGYDVGGPVGTAQYVRHNRQRRLGGLLAITRTNVDQYAGQPRPAGTPWPC